MTRPLSQRSADPITADLIQLCTPAAETEKKQTEETADESIVIPVTVAGDDTSAVSDVTTERAAIVEEVRAHLVRWLPKHKSVRDADHANELAQETALILWSKSDEDWRKIRDYRNYAFGVVDNLLKDHHPLVTNSAFVEVVAARDQSPQDDLRLLEVKELWALLARKVLERANAILRPKTLKVFIEYTVKGRGMHRQIAEELGRNDDAVRQADSRANNAVRGIKCSSLQERRHSLAEIEEICQRLGTRFSTIDLHDLFAETREAAGIR